MIKLDESFWEPDNDCYKDQASEKIIKTVVIVNQQQQQQENRIEPKPKPKTETEKEKEERRQSIEEFIEMGLSSASTSSPVKIYGIEEQVPLPPPSSSNHTSQVWKFQISRAF